ncbi:vam6/Vps39-like protein [Chironomus tepperi]|uniref:vam6/Vps39-like protein n=1 Tax=Chironomus tepperi TaxID=113505 RepID=UPI00391F27FA
MHKAYTLHSPSKISVQIESIAGYRNNVLLGTRQGHLLQYCFQESLEGKMELQLLQYDKNFSKKPILQLQVIEDYNLLFSLSDNIISVNDISRHNFPLIHLAIKTKGASTFSMDVQKTQTLTDQVSLVVRVCVAVKRKLQFYYWKRNELLEFAPDIELSDIPKVVSWSGNYICIGYKTEYILFDISDEKRRKQDLFPTTSSSRSIDPCVSLIDNEKFFAVVKDEHLITIPTSDDAKNNASALDSKASILDPKSGKSLPTITWSEPPTIVVWDQPYLIGLVTDSVEIRVLDKSGLEKNNLIQTIPELQKARFLINGRINQQGLIFAASVSHLWCIESIDIATQRQNLLQDKKWFLALQLTSMSDESEEDKQSITHEIQTLYAYDLFVNKQFREAMLEFSKLKTDPTNVIKLFPDLLPTSCEPQVPTRQMSSSMVESELMREMPKLTDKDLENGLLALIDYLVEIRSQVGKIQGNAKAFGRNPKILLSIIDTTLLKCYLETNDSFVSSLIRLNNCHLEESEKILKSYKKFSELIILYQVKGQHKRALTLLKTSPNFGYERIIQYLQHLGADHKKLIFEFADFVIQEHPQEGLKIFIEDIQEVENLPRADVLDFLLKNHKSLVIQYLEHIINIWNEVKPLFHNILIQQYKEQIFNLKSDPDLENVYQKKIELQTIREKLINFLKTSNKYAADKVLVEFPYDDLFEERAIVLGKLSKHEKVLAIYIQILGDVEKAIEYCDQVYCSAGTNYTEIYIILIRLLLNPPTVSPYGNVKLHPQCLQPDIETVLNVLENNAKRVNPHTVLTILPDNIPIVRLKKFLEVSLHNQLEQKRKFQMFKGLYYAENLQQKEQNMSCESKSFLITEMTLCSVCKKKFSNQCAFVRLPYGDLIHISCQAKEN